MHETLPLLEISDFPAIRREAIETLQINIGYRCNQSCVHCHVNAGPNRTEMMSDDNLELLLGVIKARGCEPWISLGVHQSSTTGFGLW
ncbi:hypothetical protein [Microbulbifer sp. MLAF003]|uniref:hypothetical protein n=1 Tax=Microbulbifer sp. MLAF003 TaxID=3032582 RepID=UPI00334007BB